MRICFCADIHIGAPNTDLSELMGCFEQMISSNDLIVIGGDILDSKFYASSDNITILMDLFEYITALIKPQKKILRLIYGTQSHDSFPQLQILEPFAHMMNFKIIPHVTVENINGVSILYIPEEIISNKREYYADTLYSGKKYDYIFGHGVIAEGMPMVKEGKVKKMTSVPVFKTEELIQACKYQVCFGHYHRRWICKNVSYVGSLTRFKNGEPEPKGWYCMEGHNIWFVNNQWAPEYTEYNLTAEKYGIDEFRNFISTKLDEFHLNSNHRDHIKFTIYLDKSKPNALSYLEIVRTLCRGEGVSYAVKDTNDTVLKDDAITEEYDYILDPSVPIKDKIIKYNGSNFDEEVDTDLLEQYISKIKIIN